MLSRSLAAVSGCFFLGAMALSPSALAQARGSEAPSVAAAAPKPPAPSEMLVVPTGTRIPLILSIGVNTRTAKAGDSVYFETVYPIAVNNRMAIPPGTFLRGKIVAARRPGRLRGRGEFRIAIEQITFSSGYTVDLLALPSSVDRDGQEGVDSENTIKGSSAAGHDTATLLFSTVGGAYIGTLAGAAANGAPGRGALLGGGIGGLAALIAVLATRGPEAELPRGTMMDVTLNRPLLLDPAILPATSGTVNDPLRSSVPPAQPRRSSSYSLRPPLWPWPLR
jgi:hypothetical protein